MEFIAFEMANISEQVFKQSVWRPITWEAHLSDEEKQKHAAITPSDKCSVKQK